MNFKQTFSLNFKIYALKYGAFNEKKIFCSFSTKFEQFGKIM